MSHTGKISVTPKPVMQFWWPLRFKISYDFLHSLCFDWKHHLHPIGVGSAIKKGPPSLLSHYDSKLFWNMNTSIFGLNFGGKYDYKYIWIPIFRQLQMQIYLGLTKMGNNYYEYKYSNCYSQIQIKIFHI